MEFGRFFQEEKPRMRVHDILDEGDHVLRHQVGPGPLGQDGDELGGLVMTIVDQSSPSLGQLEQADALGFITARSLEHRALPKQGVAARLNILCC